MEKVFDRFYSHVHNGGLTVSIIEESDTDSTVYHMGIELNNFTASSFFKFYLGDLRNVNSMIDMLNKLKVVMEKNNTKDECIDDPEFEQEI